MLCVELVEAMAHELRRLKPASEAAAACASALDVAAALEDRQKLQQAEELERQHTLLKVWLRLCRPKC